MFQVFWDRVRAGRSPAAEAEPPRDYIEDLLDEGRLIGRYRRWKGLATPDELWELISEVESLPPPRQIGHPAVVKLLRVVGQCGNEIPFSILARLKEGWDPCRPSKADRRNTFGLILLSVILVFMTGALTNVYNKGASLLAELEQLAPAESQQSYNRLLRSMLQARSQMDAATLLDAERLQQPASPPGVTEAQVMQDGAPGLTTSAQFDLARNVYYETETELSALSRQALHLQQRAITYSRLEAPFAIPGSKLIRCNLARARHYASKLVDWDAERSLFLLTNCSTGLALGDGSFEQAYSSGPQLLSADSTCLGRSGGEPAAVSRNAFGGVSPSPSLNYAKALTDLAQELTRCRVTSFMPVDFPSITALSNDVRDALTPLGLLFLPALYGAIGAILSLMRVVIEPLTPTPKAPTMFHRIAFGAAAGIVLIWFITPDMLVGTQVADIGLSLFGLTFLSTLR